MLLKDTPNKGNNTFNFLMKDKFSCGPYRTMHACMAIHTILLNNSIGIKYGST